MGFYSFTDVPTGAVYVLEVRSKSYSFEPRVVSLNDSLTDVDFVPVKIRKR